MTIILFLVDTSASMCQKAYVNGVQKSYLDIAKGAVETFLKYRQRSQDCMGDRYMLLTFEDPPSNVKAGWKENHATFMNELKNLQSIGLTSMGEALRNAFDLLNLNRMQSGIDTYGQGRCPFYLEPSVIIVITDGGKYSFKNGVHQEIILPLNPQTTGAKLTKEPFRWDQRLFSLVLRMAGNRVDERVEGKVSHDDSPIEKMCEVTGGRSYRVKSHYVLNQCIESLVQKVQPGVVVHFEQLMPKDLKDGEIQDIVFGTTKKMIYVQKHPTQKTFPVGFWPIPEPYWPDPKANNLPPRDAHPKIRIMTPCVEEPLMVRNFPIDKYEVEPSPLTLQILSKREPTKCWQVIVSNGIHGLETPFGYLKASANFAQVYLMILPYNYPVLLPLLNDLFKFNLNPPNDWVYKFSSYVRSIPQYYGPFLRRALASSNVPFQLLQYILPENLDSYLSPAVANYLKTMKSTAKQEQENMCLRVFKQLKLPKPPYHQVETAKLNCGLPMKRELVTHPQLKETFSKMHTEISMFENYTIVVPTIFQQSSAKNYRNPFEVPRRDLIDEISRMRENFLKLPTSGINIFTKDAGHCLPISEMGNYQEYLKNKQSPLREIEPTNVRQHMFGNPYKKDKHMVMVDEADLGDVAPMKPNASNAAIPNKKTEPTSRPRKRKPGPIRKDYIFQRKSIDSDDSILGSPRSTTSTLCSSMETDDDQSIADTASTASDDEENDLVIDFNDNEPNIEEYYSNGHVQDFINGSGEDADESIIHISATPSPVASGVLNVLPPTIPAPVAAAAVVPAVPVAVTVQSVSNLLNNFIVPQPSSLQPASVLFSSATIPSSLLPAINHTLVVPPITATNVSTVSITTTTTATTPTTTTTTTTNTNNIGSTNRIIPTPLSLPLATINNGSSPANIHQSQNDYEAQEISKILQQCTNGMDQQRYQKDEQTINNVPVVIAPSVAAAPATALAAAATPTDLIDQQHGMYNDITTAKTESAAMGTAVAAAEILKDEMDIDDDEQKENVKQTNQEARSVIFKDIRRPGRDYTLLLEHLSLVRGSLETRFTFIQMCISESLRFRRKKMADSIQEWWDKQIDSTMQT